MKTSELIRANYDRIIDCMLARYRCSMECNGRTIYQIYIWDDGELEVNETVPGSHDWPAPREGSSHDLHYILDVQGFNPWDIADCREPDDEEEADAMRQELIDMAVDSYRDLQAEINLDGVIEDREKGDD